MKKLLIVFLPLIGLAQTNPNYWQQHVHYQMDIDFDSDKHQFTGVQKLSYTNNSPDTLKQVFYHLQFNAFQPGSMMDERSRDIADPDKRIGTRVSKLNNKEIGYHKINSLMQNGQAVSYEVHQTLLKVLLAEPILPGGKAEFEMKFNSQVPVQIRRSGRDNADGIDYTMTQWYPKMAEYDEHGWHADPYIAREFHGVFGTFDVNINIDYQYKLGGTGVHLTEEANWVVQSEGEDGLKTYKLQKSKKGKRTWSFHAENVHDFAWAADKEYIRTSYPGPDGLELNFFYLEELDSNWSRLPKYTAQFFKLMNKQFGKYDYPQFSVIQGGDGGMEYPMCTMLKGTGKINGLIGVMVHESAHNWYYGMLASNETQYPWMDEGFTSFAEEEILNQMRRDPLDNPHKGAFRGHAYLFLKGNPEPLSTPGDYFTTNQTYGISSYSRGELFLSQLRYIVGKESFDKGMIAYYNRWKFKHPDPWDFIKVMEDASGLQLDWYLNFWMNTTKGIDYGIAEVKSHSRGGTLLTLEKVGEMPMPLRITITTKDGFELKYYIPLASMMGAPNEGDQLVLQPWPWTNPKYEVPLEVPFKQVQSIAIDPQEEMADLTKGNNSYPAKEEKE